MIYLILQYSDVILTWAIPTMLGGAAVVTHIRFNRWASRQ